MIGPLSIACIPVGRGLRRFFFPTRGRQHFFVRKIDSWRCKLTFFARSPACGAFHLFFLLSTQGISSLRRGSMFISAIRWLHCFAYSSKITDNLAPPPFSGDFQTIQAGLFSIQNCQFELESRTKHRLQLLPLLGVGRDRLCVYSPKNDQIVFCI